MDQVIVIAGCFSMCVRTYVWNYTWHQSYTLQTLACSVDYVRVTCPDASVGRHPHPTHHRYQYLCAHILELLKHILVTSFRHVAPNNVPLQQCWACNTRQSFRQRAEVDTYTYISICTGSGYKPPSLCVQRFLITYSDVHIFWCSLNLVIKPICGKGEMYNLTNGRGLRPRN